MHACPIFNIGKNGAKLLAWPLFVSKSTDTIRVKVSDGAVPPEVGGLAP